MHAQRHTQYSLAIFLFSDPDRCFILVLFQETDYNLTYFDNGEGYGDDDDDDDEPAYS